MDSGGRTNKYDGNSSDHRKNRCNSGEKILVRVWLYSIEQFVCLVNPYTMVGTVMEILRKGLRILSHLRYDQLRLYLDSGEPLYIGQRLYPIRDRTFVLKVVAPTALRFFHQLDRDNSFVSLNFLGVLVLWNTYDWTLHEDWSVTKKRL
jgi:hypothetical protein